MITLFVKPAASKVFACNAQWEEAEQSRTSTPLLHDSLKGNARS